MDLWLGRLAGPVHPLDTPRTAHTLLLSSDRFARSSWTKKNGFCHLPPCMWPGLPHSPPTGHYPGSRGPRRAALPRTREQKRDRVELGRFALPPRTKEFYTRSKELCEDILSPGLGSEHNSSSSYNGPPGLQHGDSFARASRLEQGALCAPHTGRFRLDELDEASRRTLEGLRNGFSMDINYLIICTHCDLMM